MGRFLSVKDSDTSDISLINIRGTHISDLKTIKIRTIDAQWPNIIDIILLLFPALALFLWSISLQKISLNDMNDLGLISALSPRIIAALAILVVSFVISLQRKKLRVALLAFQLVCIIGIIYGTPHLIEQAVRFTPLYRHEAYTEYIMHTGTVDPSLDTYFSWPSFFTSSAFITKILGYSTILSYAGWAPIFYNLIYLGPMYIIGTTMTTNKRVIWLSMLLFQLTNWVGQDYFSPQGLNFFLYLVIIAILLKWFRKPGKEQLPLAQDASLKQKIFFWFNTPELPSPELGVWQRRALLACVLLIFGLIVSSHPLTPFFILLSVFALVLFRRCSPFWLPFLMALMTLAWIIIVARLYLAHHIGDAIGTLGDLTGNVPKSITKGQLKESSLYQIIAKLRLYMTLLLWFLAFLGALKRLRQGHHDLTYMLLAVSGFLLIAAQSYGGEMLMRVYLFSQPIMVFFAASLFYDNALTTPSQVRQTALWRTATILTATLLLLGTFFFTRYGDEHVDFISYDEWHAAQYLNQVAPTHSLVMSAWNDAPLLYENYGKYKLETLTYDLPEAVINTDANTVVQIFASQNGTNGYIFFSQEEQVHASAWDGLPSDALQRLETRLLQTGKFKVIYRNADAQILQFIG